MASNNKQGGKSAPKSGPERNTLRRNGKAWKKRLCGKRHSPSFGNCADCTMIEVEEKQKAAVRAHKRVRHAVERSLAKTKATKKGAVKKAAPRAIPGASSAARAMREGTVSTAQKVAATKN